MAFKFKSLVSTVVDNVGKISDINRWNTMAKMVKCVHDHKIYQQWVSTISPLCIVPIDQLSTDLCITWDIF